ncbi:Metallo-dependent phosphatase-like protein, partial [Mycena amicta]
ASSDLWHRFTQSTPDFSRYAPPRALSSAEFPIHQPHKRVLVLGDIHGMSEPFEALLHKLEYNPSSDVLLHVGDIVAKGPHEGSLAVLKFMASHNITGVRGNHDQKAEPDDPEEWAEKHLKRSKDKWTRKIPTGWKPLSDHYRVARDMTAAQFEYLVHLPLVLHASEAHVLIAHAGVLSSDPNYKPSHRRQPLAHVPSLPSDFDHSEDKIAALRRLQEAALLVKVPQNQDSWVTLNMRGILADKSWNRDIGFCAGFDGSKRHRYHARKTELPCFPATVVYGHAASRGLDVKRWSVGLDSGCVKGNRLSALVLDAKLQSTLFDEGLSRRGEAILEARKKQTIQFGEGSARIVDVKCT